MRLTGELDHAVAESQFKFPPFSKFTYVIVDQNCDKSEDEGTWGCRQKRF